MRMRYAAEAAAEIRAADPGSAVTERMIRNLALQGVIPSVYVGNGTRRLVDLDALLAYLEHPAAGTPEAVHGIRRVTERGM